MIITSPVVAQPPAAKVKTAFVTSEAIQEKINLTGTVQPKRQTLISAEVSGLISEMLVDEGDYVQEGQILARIRSRPTELSMNEMKAELLIESSRLDELKNGTRPEDIDREAANKTDAQANLEYWEKEATRLSTLFADKAVSESEYQLAVRNRDQARATLQLQTAEYQKAVNGPRAEEISAQMGEVEAVQARIDLENDKLERHTIRAPFSGIIGVKQIEKGQWVNTGDMAFGMAQVDMLRVQVPLPERYFSDVQLGTMATLEFPSLPNTTVTAPVTAKIPLADEGSRTFPVRVEFENTNLTIAPGMLARVTLQPSVSADSQSLLVPKDAVVMSPDDSRKVYVVRDVDSGPAAFPVNVRVGRNYMNLVEVFSDQLQSGTEVIVRGNETIRFPGQSVSIIEEISPQS